MVHLGHDGINATFESFLHSLLIALILYVVFSIAVGYILSHSIDKSIKSLTKTIEEISKGNLETKVSPELKADTSEIGSLARAFDRTLVKLAIYHKGGNDDERSEEEDS